MKQILPTLTFLSLYLLSCGQSLPADDRTSLPSLSERLNYDLLFGCGITANTPSSIPFLVQAKTAYSLSRRISVGAGIGISAYEKVLFPLFGSVRINLSRPHRLIPYVEGNFGYSLPLSAHTNGGLYLSPSIGTALAFSRKFRLLFSIGYELQKLERLKTQSDAHFATAFREQLRHHTFTFRAGLRF